MQNSNDLMQLFQPMSEDIHKSLTYAKTLATRRSHSRITIYHIMYGIMQYVKHPFLEMSNEKNEPEDSYSYMMNRISKEKIKLDKLDEFQRTFPYLANHPISPIFFSEMCNSTTTAKHFKIDNDVLILGNFYRLYCKKNINFNLEIFYMLIIYLNELCEFWTKYDIPHEGFDSTALCKNFETFICSNYPKSDIESMCSSSNAGKLNEIYSSPIKISYTTDLTNMAYNGKLHSIIGREKETNRIVTILSKMYKNNPVLIGEPGVGKTALVHSLAQKIVNNQCSKLQNHYILEFDVASALSGARYRGDFEERIKQTINNILSLVTDGKKIIVYIDEIHTIVGAGSAEGALDLANLLKPFLLNSELKIIGTSTFKEYRNIESDKALARRFDTIKVNEPTYAETLEILNGLRTSFENFYNVTISKSILESIISLSQRYVPEKFLPDKAINLLDDCCSIKTTNSSTSNQISVEDVFAAISVQSEIPIQKITASYDLMNLEKVLSSKVIGQNHVCSYIAKAMRRTKAGLNDENKPLASFMFIGPTGVGKTETTKALADAVFSGKMIRFDMSEYMEEHSVSKLIGAPPGYAGYEDAGLLTEQVRRNPYSLVLFDEFEKAHPKICNILLQILDEGSLTDSKGEHINFKNAIIILTSNIGVSELTKRTPGFGEQSSSKSKDVLNAVKKNFSPEFLNRLDEIIQFNQLSQEDIIKIAKLNISTLIEKLKKQNIEIDISEEVVSLIAELGYNPEYGARELKRTIMREIINPLSDFILQNNDIASISVELVDNEIKLSHKVASPV